MRRYGSRTLNKYFEKRYRTCRFHCPSFDVTVGVRFTRSKPSGNPALNSNSKGDMTMRFMVIVKANKDSEAGGITGHKPPSPKGEGQRKNGESGGAATRPLLVVPPSCKDHSARPQP